MIEGYTTVKEMSEGWQLSQRSIQIMCAEGKIKGATKFVKSWAIPVNAERPDDGRVVSGEYKGWRKKEK